MRNKAEVVRSIFAAFAFDDRPKAISKDLNERGGVPGQRGVRWSTSTI
jgi:hypothetical protein